MSEPIKIGDLVMLVRGHKCALDFKGGVPWQVTDIRMDEGFGMRCQICGQTGIGKNALRAGGMGTPAGVKGHPDGGMPLSWLKRIPPLSELDAIKREEKEPA